MENHSNPIIRLTFNFALEIMKYSEKLADNKKYIISNQILKSGTSIGANVMESQNAESKLDFIHKLKVASKELFETEYWLLLCQKSDSYPDPINLLLQISEIKKVLNTIISTSKKSLKTT